MKGNVFIGWNLSDALALEVKLQLKKFGYNGIVGGKNNAEVEHSVGATIISQMKKCSSAIMLFSPRPILSDCALCERADKFETLSGNMLYELGYLTGSLKLKRVLAVYIDHAVNLAPTDLKGGWDFQISSYKIENGQKVARDTVETAKEIVEFFVAEQKDSLTQNKMEMITDISALRSILLGHTKSPVLYETEIATIVMLFCQAAYMDDDIDNSEKVLKELLHSGIQNENCLLAISSSFDYFNACRALTKNEYDNMYLPRKDYQRLLNNLLEYIDDIQKVDDSDPFKSLFLMVTYDYISFINMMYYADYDKDDLDDEIIYFREESAKKSIYYSQKYREFDPSLNSQLSSLYESYTYRNLALFYRTLEKNELANECFEKSISSRRELYMYFRTRDLNDSIFEQINMEYHLALIDNIFDVDETERNRRRRELKAYVEEANESSYNRIYLINKISKILDEIKKG